MDVLKPHERDLGGGLIVSRVLPGHPHQMVGPFIFFDQMGPITAARTNIRARTMPRRVRPLVLNVATAARRRYLTRLRLTCAGSRLTVSGIR